LKKKAANATRTGRINREKTMSTRMLARDRVSVHPDLVEWMERLRPKTRDECKGGARPCPHVSCKHHLYLDVNPKNGSIKFNFPDLEPHEMVQSCALDVADQGGLTLEEVGQHLNLTRERVRQLEASGKEKLKEEFAQIVDGDET